YRPNWLNFNSDNYPARGGVLRGKIEALCSLIEDDDFTLNVFAWGIPDPTMKEDVGYWLESKVSEIYAVS
ncbi:hypothetical protein AB6E16_22860, partial [Vibrio atlanticus]